VELVEEVRREDAELFAVDVGALRRPEPVSGLGESFQASVKRRVAEMGYIVVFEEMLPEDRDLGEDVRDEVVVNIEALAMPTCSADR